MTILEKLHSSRNSDPSQKYLAKKQSEGISTNLKLEDYFDNKIFAKLGKICNSIGISELVNQNLESSSNYDFKSQYKSFNDLIEDKITMHNYYQVITSD